MKSVRQHAYEVGVEYQLAAYKRSRKAHVLLPRFRRLVGSLTTVEDVDWLRDNLAKRFPDQFFPDQFEDKKSPLL